MDRGQTGKVVARIMLASPPEVVYRFLSTETGRTGFWADKAPEIDGFIHLEFSNGMKLKSRLLEKVPDKIFAFEYFGGSRAVFHLEAAGGGGTLLTLEETGIDPAWFAEQRAGWVSVLLTLKAAVDFSVDLRNPDPGSSWEQGFVDV